MSKTYLYKSLARFPKVRSWVGALLLSLFSIVANAAVISANVSNTNPHIGEMIDVNFSISGLSAAPGNSLSAFDLDILFDDSVFAFTSFSFTDLGSGSNQLDLPEMNKFPFAGNVIVSGIGILDAYGLSGNSNTVLDTNQAGSFRFLGLTFTAIAEAPSSTISIDLNDPFLFVLDSSFGDLPVSYSPAAVILSVSSTPINVPEPNSTLLLAAGIPLLLAKIRKHNGMTRR